MTTMLLKNLIDNLNSKISNLKIRKISADSRKIQKGDWVIICFKIKKLKV